MKRFFRALGRFFWSWGFLKFVLWTVTLIVFFYVEEDWRGARAWAATKAKWEARGETFDLKTFFPKPIPDEQNLGALPLFRLEREAPGQKDSYLDCIALREALKNVGDSELPPLNGWIQGNRPDLEKIRLALSSRYSKAFKDGPAHDPLTQCDALYPFLGELRTAAQTRPYCRFPFDDTQALPAGRSLRLVTGQLRLSKLLVLHALLALDEHQFNLALADFETVLKLRSGAGHDPSLVGGLVGIGLFALGNSIVYDGLARHAWSDVQLEKIIRLLRPIDALANYQFSMKSEAATAVGNLDYFKKVRRSDICLALGTYPGQVLLPSHGISALLLKTYSLMDDHWRSGYSLWPAGWLDQNKAGVVDSILRKTQGTDDAGKRVDPEVSNELEREAGRVLESTWGLAPWNVLGVIMGPGSWKESPKFAIDQVRVDEARIACALERYRLAHGVHPESLEALVPACIDALPHDIMNGQPYRYQLHADGSYLLYSVGWNQTDEGGQVVYDKASPSQIDYDHGDWVWFGQK